MTTTTNEATVSRTRVEWATVPRVNLLPAEIIAGRAFRRTQKMMAGVVGVVVVLGGLGTVWAHNQVGAAQAELEAVQARTAELQAQQRKYAEVPRVLAQVDGAKAAREQAMGRDVLWYRFLDELAADSPSGVLLGTLEVAMSDSSGALAPDALTPAGLGRVAVTGQARKYTDVASWLSSVVTVTGMELSRLQTAELSDSAKSDSGIDFTADVRIADAALSHRYDRKAG
jgi:hypothetical protein